MTGSRRDPSVGWKYVGHCAEGDRFEIEGVNVWSEKWRSVPGLLAEVRDPQYGQDFRFAVYEIPKGNTILRFAAGEFSVNVFGFYVPEPG